MAFQPLPPFDIPHNVVRKSPFRFLILPVSQYEKAHFRVRYGAFQPPIWPISHVEMVLFAMRKMQLRHKLLIFNVL